MPRKDSFSKKLNAWYRKNARDLPWRHTSDPYKVWISEIMLQQTTVNAVIPYYRKWMDALPTVHHVAKASLRTILRLWQGLGYYSRAKNIRLCAKIICAEYGGTIPDDPVQLRALPGFGPYTVGAVLSIAFDNRYPIIDANVRRVMMRVLALKGMADASKDRLVLNALDRIMPRRNLRTFNQALMELGALVCRSREPVCLSCPVRVFCAGYKSGIQEIIPEPKKRVIRDVDAVVGIFRHDGKYFIQKRPDKGLLADLWEFPGGKIKENESLQDALKREIMEELNINLKRSKHLMNVRHYYTQFRVNLHVSLCEASSLPGDRKDRKWVKLNSLQNYPMPSGSAKIVDHLIKIDCKI